MFQRFSPFSPFNSHINLRTILALNVCNRSLAEPVYISQDLLEQFPGYNPSTEAEKFLKIQAKAIRILTKAIYRKKIEELMVSVVEAGTQDITEETQALYLDLYYRLHEIELGKFAIKYSADLATELSRIEGLIPSGSTGPTAKYGQNTPAPQQPVTSMDHSVQLFDLLEAQSRLWLIIDALGRADCGWTADEIQHRITNNTNQIYKLYTLMNEDVRYLRFFKGEGNTLMSPDGKRFRDLLELIQYVQRVTSDKMRAASSK